MYLYIKQILTVLILILVIALFGNRVSERQVDTYALMPVSIANSDSDLFPADSAITLLGKGLHEIVHILGEPKEQGYSNYHGPHYFLLYGTTEEYIQFCSPKGLEDKAAVSIILTGKESVLGTKVGMTFSEIKNILGEPDFGPELDQSNAYYMSYYFGDIKNQVPEYFISFSAETPDAPVYEIFIKWEGFEYNSYLEI